MSTEPLTNHQRGYRGNQFGPPRPLSERFWERVDKSGECWVYTGYTNPKGYGVVGLESGNKFAHRVAWELTNGLIPDGLWVLHRCDNPPCVRPEHLWLGDNTDNQRDSVRKGRWHATHQHLVSGAARWKKS